MSDSKSGDDDSIVLGNGRGHGAVANPLDTDETLAFKPVDDPDSAKHKLQLTLPVSRVDVARAVLRKHDAVVVVDDGGTDVAEAVAEREGRKSDLQQIAEDRHAEREADRAFDPRDGTARNSRQLHAKAVYEQLVEEGRDGDAEEVRDLVSAEEQIRRGNELLDRRESIRKRMKSGKRSS